MRRIRSRILSAQDRNGRQPSDLPLYRCLDPNGGPLLNVVVHDRRVENTKNSRPGGLEAHNYWDNHDEFVASIPELFHDAGIDRDVAARWKSTGRDQLFPGRTNDGQRKESGAYSWRRIRHGRRPGKPVVQLLEDIHVLGTDEDYKSSGNWTTALTGPPPSIAIIEAGATAAARVGAVPLPRKAACLRSSSSSRGSGARNTTRSGSRWPAAPLSFWPRPPSPSG